MWLPACLPSFPMQPDYSIPSDPQLSAATAADGYAIPAHPTAPAGTPSDAGWNTRVARPGRQGSSHPAAAAAATTRNGSTEGAGSGAASVASATEVEGELEVVGDPQC